MTKRIFILSPDSPDRLGGVEHFVREIGKGLEARGYQIEFFHRGNSTPEWLRNRSGRIASRISGSLTGLFVGRKAMASFDDSVVAIISNSTVGYYPFRSPRNSLKRFHVYHGTYRGQAEAIKPFISYRGYLFVKWWESMVIERLSGRSKTVFSCSDPIREEVLAYFGFPSKTMWYPIDLNRFGVQDPYECRKELGLHSEDQVGVFVGNMSPMKNFEIVRALIKALPNVCWLLALRGETTREFEENPRVKTFRNVPADQIPRFYGAADFSVCPSRYDPFPYVVSESLACGTPVIAPPHGASRFFLSEPPLDRLLVSGPDAIDEFVSAVREVLRDPALYRRLVQERARPLLEEAMGPESWWRRFCSETGL
jgi:glycosyltransferase involved in cell wall biosynthesis